MIETGETSGIDRSKHVTGYTRVGVAEGDGSYDAGFSMYATVWPLLQEYPGHAFQSGLFGTWMYADSKNPEIEGVWFYSTLEGGLGWWRDTEYPTETPKFIMGATALGFCAWANGPGAGKGRDWSNPAGHYGAAQLSPNLLWPPDGVNIKQGTCGKVLGYGYQPLPLTKAKSTTAGAAVPTGNQCWTLFLNAGNFKGPATFILPYFFTKPSIDQPRTAGLFLDSRPAKQNRTHSMETQYIPWVQATDSQGRTFARMAPVFFPAGHADAVPVLQQITAYNKQANWTRVEAWLNGGEPADSVIDPEHTFVHKFDESRGVEWAIAWPGLKREDRIPVETAEFIRPSLTDPYCLTYAAKSDLIKAVDGTNDKLMILPEYYQFVEAPDGGKGKWIAVAPEGVPEETGLGSVRFGRPEEAPPKTYVTPEDPESCWKSPGPVAGPFVARPGDGSEITYYWYRFADQPAVRNADLTDAEREDLQIKVDAIHRHWTKDKEYLAPPAKGELADIDPALILAPPEGLEIGYVPIATKQGPARQSPTCLNDGYPDLRNS